MRQYFIDGAGFFTMVIFGIPLWLLLLLIIVVVLIGWKLVKFALTLLVVLILVLGILTVVDMLWPHLTALF